MDLLTLMLIIIFSYESHQGYFSKLGLYWKNMQFDFYLKWFALLAVSITGSFFLDAPLLKSIQQIHSPFLEVISKFGGQLGGGQTPWLLIAGCYVLAILSRSKNWRRRVFSAFLSVVLTGNACVILKRTILRARPETLQGTFSFFNPGGFFHAPFQSFPSLDVIMVAGAAGFLFYAVRNRFLRLFLLALPFTTALSRISKNVHWPSDALFSIGLGFLIGLFVWRYQKYSEDNP